MTRLLVFLTLFSLGPIAVAVADERLPLTDLFVAGQGGYHTYRIPAIVTANDGALVAICEGRKTSRADHGDVDLVARRSADGGKTWSPITLIYDEGGDKKITIGNPCPVVDRLTGVIWLPFTRDNDDVLIVSSKDGGKTWSKPATITASVKKPGWTWYATGPGNGIQLTRGPHKGRLVIPCDHRLKSIPDRSKSSHSHVIYSDDHGANWKRGGPTENLMNECAVAEREDGSLLLNIRSLRGRKRRALAVSRDGGLSWSACRDAEALIEPVCQGSMLRATWSEGGEKSRLLFCNPASTSGRRRLTIRASYDEGATWPASRLVYDGSSAYSCMTRLPGGDVGVLFERDDYAKISFARIAVDEIEEDGRRKEQGGKR